MTDAALHVSDPPHPRLQAWGLSALVPSESGPQRVLQDVHVDLMPGELVDLTGPSGSGKSMLLRALARLLPGANGRMALDGVDANHIAPFAWRTQVALLAQKPSLVPGTVKDNLCLPWTFKAREDEHAPADETLRHGLADLGLEDIALDRDGARLSVGQQARLAFLRTLLTKPKVLLLDEADAALDEASAVRLKIQMEAFLLGGGSVLRSRHRAGDGLASRRVHMEQGRLSEIGGEVKSC